MDKSFDGFQAKKLKMLERALQRTVSRSVIISTIKFQSNFLKSH